jgi:D-glycero-alpha-D-manno-heptose-7-phosphate kinase
LKREWSGAVTNATIDEAYERAMNNGALGGKITGAGGGGFLLLFVPESGRKTIVEAMSGLCHVPFEFDFGGSQVIFANKREA